MFVLAIIMLNRGLTGLGISLPKKDYANFLTAKVDNEYQVVDFNLTYDNYANIIYFTPDKEGSYTITCWLNMLKNTILVTSDETYFKGGS